MSIQANSGTPKGTKPCETRVSTKHKRIEYGLLLQAKNLERWKRRLAGMALPEQAARTVRAKRPVWQ